MSKLGGIEAPSEASPPMQICAEIGWTRHHTALSEAKASISSLLVFEQFLSGDLFLGDIGQFEQKIDDFVFE